MERPRLNRCDTTSIGIATDVKKSGWVLPWDASLSKSSTKLTEACVGKRGITTRQFQELTRFIKRLCRTGILRYTTEARKGERILWTNVTMYEVCYNVVKPVMESLGSQHRYAWSTLVNKGIEREPKVFISHSWDEKFPDFASSFHHLKLDRGLTATDVVWICTFANNQFELDLQGRLSNSPFHGALRYASQVALFLDHTASALGRSWCNFEMAISTDTPQNRMRWRKRRELANAEEGDGDLFRVDWLQVERSIYAELRNCKSEKQLLLCTPAGMVGTQRVTSGPVLKALATHKSSDAESYRDVDRRRIMNHIAYKYLLDEEGSTPDNDPEMNGLQELLNNQQQRFLLADDKLADDKRPAPRRASNRIEYQYEFKLVTEPQTKQQFQMLDETIFMVCSKALEQRGIRAPRDVFTQDASKPKMLTNKWAPKKLESKVSGLTLAQLRDLEVLLRTTCKESNMKIDGKKLEWEDCNSRHMHHSARQSTKTVGNNEWEGLGKAFLPEMATYAECVNDSPQPPEYFVIMPWDMPFVDVFRALEWHAEALGLSDRTTYYIQAFTERYVPKGKPKSAPKDTPKTCPAQETLRNVAKCEEVMEATTEGVLILVSEALSQKWKESAERQSLWVFFEVWLADQCRLPWDIACSTGICATSRPFVNKKWECGVFNPRIAENLAHMEFDAERACAPTWDRPELLGRIERSEGGVPGFNRTVTARLSMRMLAPIMRHTAYMDNGMASFERLNAALKLLQRHRCRFFLDLQTFEGSFGETPLHIAAARRDLGGCAEGHATMLALVHAGFDVNYQDNEGETPLHWAAFAGAEWTTKFLLRQGANPMVASYNGELPIHVAQARPSSFLREYPSGLESLLDSAMRPWLPSKGSAKRSNITGEDMNMRPPKLPRQVT